MKKTGFILLNILLVILGSCGSKPKDEKVKEVKVSGNPVALITEAIDAANAQCPIQLSSANNVVMDSAAYNGRTITYYYSINRIADGFDPGNDNLKKSMFYMIRSEMDMSPIARTLMETLVSSGGDIRYHYQAADGKSYSIGVSNTELKEILGD